MNTKILPKVIIFIFTCIFIQTGTAQNNEYLNKILKNYEHIDSVYHRQKVFVHTDKQTYFAGESIMLSAYVLNTLNLCDKYSSILHVDILTPANELLFEQKLKLINGLGIGDFKIPDDIYAGNYILRAYTNFMKNFEPEKIFVKSIVIKNKEKYFYTKELLAKIKKHKKKFKKTIFNLYPEGGILTAETENKIYFNISNFSGKNIEVQGKILDNEKKVIVEFENKKGKGFFYLTPEKNKKYFAVIDYNGKKKMKIKLPEISNFAYNLHLKNINENNFVFEIKNNLPKNNDKSVKTVILTARTDGKTLFGKQVFCDKKLEIVKINRKQFPAGIINFILFDAKENKMAELFLHNNINNKISVKSDMKIIGDSTFVNLSFTDKNNIPVNANLSISIVGNPNNEEYKLNENIKLYSEITSRTTEKPEFIYKFMKNNNNDFDFFAGNLTANNSEKKIFSEDEEEPEFEIQKSFSLSGKVTKQMLELPVQHSKITLYVLNKHNDRHTTLTNKEGKFTFKNLEYNDTIEMQLETRNFKDKKAYIINADENKKLKTPEINIYNPEIEIEKLKKGKKYYRKNYKYEHKESEEEKHKDGKLHSYADQTIYMNKVPTGAYSDLMQILQAYVPGVSKYSMSALRGINSITASSEPLYLIDGIPTDKSFMSSLSPEDVERLEVLKSPGNTAIYGSRGANGVIAAYTKRGKNTKLGELTLKMLGYHTPNKFVFEKNKIIAGKETTLYWNPKIKLNKKGQTNFKLKIPESCKSYNIIIQGITEKGTPIYFNQKF